MTNDPNCYATLNNSKPGPQMINTKDSAVFSQNALVSNNIIFKKLLFLTNIRKDEATIKKLFCEQGLVVTTAQIRSWTTNPPSNNFEVMPDVALLKFIDGLFSIRSECKNQEINMFDLKDIFKDIRDKNAIAA